MEGVPIIFGHHCQVEKRKGFRFPIIFGHHCHHHHHLRERVRGSRREGESKVGG